MKHSILATLSLVIAPCVGVALFAGIIYLSFANPMLVPVILIVMMLVIVFSVCMVKYYKEFNQKELVIITFLVFVCHQL